MNLLEKIKKEDEFFYEKDNLPNIKVGDSVKIVLFIELPKSQDSDSGKKEKKERIQLYEGVVISKHGKKGQIDATLTVRKVFQGVGIEKVFLVNSPWLKTVEVINSAKVRRSKLYYLRERRGKSARLKRIF
jgi:large subunit ribosomal protein L19